MNDLAQAVAESIGEEYQIRPEILEGALADYRKELTKAQRRDLDIAYSAGGAYQNQSGIATPMLWRALATLRRKVMDNERGATLRRKIAPQDPAVEAWLYQNIKGGTLYVPFANVANIALERVPESEQEGGVDRWQATAHFQEPVTFGGAQYTRTIVGRYIYELEGHFAIQALLTQARILLLKV